MTSPTKGHLKTVKDYKVADITSNVSINLTIREADILARLLNYHVIGNGRQCMIIAKIADELNKTLPINKTALATKKDFKTVYLSSNI